MENLVFVGMIIALIGTSTYIIQMFKGKAKPNRVSWLIWSIAPLIAAFAAISSGVTLAVIPVFMAGFGPLIVFIISLFIKEAYWKITKFDYICGGLSILALILWYVTSNPKIAIIFSIISDFLACVPTIAKAWKYPETESSIAYLGGMFSAATSFAAAGVWDFESLGYSIYLILADITIVFAINHKHIFKSKDIEKSQKKEKV